ncbi:hypothetical protein J6590_002218 [Homalodisca vitripennis]|nr:hypothetical protein J6590_002218 [Homalodisca vitripennis]
MGYRENINKGWRGCARGSFCIPADPPSPPAQSDRCGERECLTDRYTFYEVEIQKASGTVGLHSDLYPYRTVQNDRILLASCSVQWDRDGLALPRLPIKTHTFTLQRKL